MVEPRGRKNTQEVPILSVFMGYPVITYPEIYPTDTMEHHAHFSLSRV